MDWAPIDGPSASGIDWTAMAVRRIDPYLVWADLTRFTGVQRAGNDTADGPDASPPVLRVALELAGHDASSLGGVQWHRSVALGDTTYATASVSCDELGALLQQPRLRRLELGFTGVPPASGAAAKQPPVVQVAGVVVAVIDFGCAFAHERFRHGGAAPDKPWRTRIRYLWDQSPAPQPLAEPWQAVTVPGCGDYGRELDHQGIERLLARHSHGRVVDEDAVYADAGFNDSTAPTWTHGTHVLDLAAGAAPEVPFEAEPSIIFVQLPGYAVDDTSGGSMVTHVLDAMRYILDRVTPDASLVVNLSYGSIAGPHDGTTLLEAALDAMLQQERGRGRRFEIVLPAGNSFEADTHARMLLSADKPAQILMWQVQADDPTDSFLEVWYPRSRAGALALRVASPVGTTTTVGPTDGISVLQLQADGLPIAAVIHRACVAGGLNDAMALVALAPTRVAPQSQRPQAPSGVWWVEVSLAADAVRDGPLEVHAWIERDDPSVGSGAPPRQSCFLSDDVPLPRNELGPEDAVVQRRGSGSSIANGAFTTVVGACLKEASDDVPFEMARYSSAGPNRAGRRWPHLVAPGDESAALEGIVAAGTRSGAFVRMNGSSAAAPQVARCFADAFAGRRNNAVVPQGPEHPAAPLRAGGGRLEP